MSNVIPFDPSSRVLRDDVPPHMDDYGHSLLLVVLSDLVRLRDDAAGVNARQRIEPIVKQIGVVLARYETGPEGAA